METASNVACGAGEDGNEPGRIRPHKATEKNSRRKGGSNFIGHHTNCAKSFGPEGNTNCVSGHPTEIASIQTKSRIVKGVAPLPCSNWCQMVSSFTLTCSHCRPVEPNGCIDRIPEV